MPKEKTSGSGIPRTKHYEVSFVVEPEDSSDLIAEAFGIDSGWVNRIVNVDLPTPLPNITLITGESGCGKSTLLKQLGTPTPFHQPDKPLHAWANSDEEALRLLNSVGLNDASLFVLRYSQLSDSQQARARMYFWLCQNQKTLIVDEFLATLDRRTAKALAYSFQKMLRREGVSLVAATAQDDLEEFLQPDLTVVGRAFPSRWTVKVRAEHSTINPFLCSLVISQETGKSKKTTIGGTCKRCGKGVLCVCGELAEKNTSLGKDAYRESRLGELHYKGKYVGGPQEYFSAKLDGEIVGWLVGALGRTNQHRIARVVVHPTYRGCGVGQLLIKEYLKHHPDADTVAAMARFNPVFERAGMERTADVEIEPPTFLKEIPLSQAAWGSKKACKALLTDSKYRALIVKHAKQLGRDTHPGGISPGEAESPWKSIEECFKENDTLAAQALWRARPRKMAKYVGPKHKLYTGVKR